MSKVVDIVEKKVKADIGGSLVLLAGIGVGGYVLFKGLQKMFKTDAEAQAESTVKEAEKTVKDLEKKMQPSRSLAQWRIVADSIYNAIKFSAIADNKELAVRQLKTVKNDLDLALLIQAYGVRQHYFFAMPDGDKTTLVGQISTGELSDKQIADINSDYASKGIKFRF